MERTMSVEDKIRRAEEIYAKRQEGTKRKTTTVSLNDNSRKDIKLLKKMIIQILISLLIYLVIYVIQNNNYIFSEDFLKKSNEILSYDINFSEMYQNIKINIEKGIGNIKNNYETCAAQNGTENKNYSEGNNSLKKAKIVSIKRVNGNKAKIKGL